MWYWRFTIYKLCEKSNIKMVWTYRNIMVRVWRLLLCTFDFLTLLKFWNISVGSLVPMDSWVMKFRLITIINHKRLDYRWNLKFHTNSFLKKKRNSWVILKASLPISLKFERLSYLKECLIPTKVYFFLSLDNKITIVLKIKYIF